MPQFIAEDKVLNLLLLGVFGLPLLVILQILLSFLGINTSIIGEAFNYLFYVFGISLFSLAIYIPFFKKTTTAKNKESKALIFIWILVSLITLLILVKIYPDLLSIGEGMFSSPSLENFAFLLLILGAVLFVVGIPFLILNLIVGKSLPEKRLAIISSVASSVVASLIVACLVYILKPNFYITEFPYISEELLRIDPNEWICESMVYSGLRADKDFLREKDGVKGRVEKGTDKVNIKIDGKVLQFNTGAAFEAGIMEGEPFQILRNDNEFLVALDTSEKYTYVDTFILEKSTGLAIWIKARTSSLIAEHPDAQSFYLICR